MDDLNTHLARLRTIWALERTQLAWVRTAFAVMLAGLSLDKAAHALHELKLLRNGAWVDGSYLLAVVGASASALLLALATWMHLKRLDDLDPDAIIPRWHSPVVMMSMLVVLLGAIISFLLIIWG